MLNNNQKLEIFGKPGDDRNLVMIKLPYPNKIEFIDKMPETYRMQCHKLVAPIFLNIYKDVLSHYGLPQIKKLGIDRFSGCYNFRPMRGSKQWSSHAWGIAEDKYAAKNGLKTKWVNSLFYKPVYKSLIDIYYDHGFCNQGKELGFDAMHFEFLKFVK
jgi:hypothetical protein